MKFNLEISLTDLLTLLTIIITIVFNIIQINHIKTQLKNDKIINDENERKRIMPYLIPKLKLNIFEKATQKDLQELEIKHNLQNFQSFFKVAFDEGEHIIIGISNQNTNECYIASDNQSIIDSINRLFIQSNISLMGDQILNRVKILELKNLGEVAYEVNLCNQNLAKVAPRVDIDAKEIKSFILVFLDNETYLDFNIIYKDMQGNQYMQ